MSDLINKRLRALTGSVSDTEVGVLHHGIEKESLRVDSDGTLAQTPHPRGLGSALTHPRITTDFSESLLELVTPPLSTTVASSDYLRNLHTFIYRHLDAEVLWGASMPCVVPQDELIPVADYGSANVGQMKRVYRLGLGHRYGRVMQTIAGIHFNFSMEAELLADVISAPRPPNAGANQLQHTVSAAYFGLLRNFHRHCWLLLYLFGASPAVCRSFLQGQPHSLADFDDHTVFAPYGTSLRMGDLGYQNNAQNAIEVDVNSVEGYTRSLVKATNTVHPPYEAIGLVDEHQVRKQLNANLLQIENEYYAVIRPKRVARSGEKPSHALRERGVEYVEMRCIDLDPFAPTGISIETSNFLLVFGLYCLFDASPDMNRSDLRAAHENQRRTINEGRRPGIKLIVERSESALTPAAYGSLDKISDIAGALDDVYGGGDFTHSVSLQREKLKDPEATPSARVVREMRERNETYFAFAMRYAQQSAKYFSDYDAPVEAMSELARMSADSISEQERLEADNAESFEHYLARYFAQ